MKQLRLYLLLLTLVMLFVVCCSPEPRRRSKSKSDDRPDVGQVTDTGDTLADATDASVDVDDTHPSVCGNGIFEAGELCDPGITSGPGTCPITCDDGNACTEGRLLGDASACTAHCVFDPITACLSDDGCCPSGCTPDDDNDCVAGCGDGVLDPGESCDPGIETGAGSCPTTCVHADACLSGSLEGSASTCTARCVYSPITQCLNGDGCCPEGCTSQNDDDCTSTCVPLTCAQAGVQCGSTSNGCGQSLTCPDCPSGQRCDAGQCVTDCVPLTCAQAGVQCGTTSNGCGSTMNCPSCPQGQSCQDGQCQGVGTGAVGDACTNASSCEGANSICVTEVDFKHGYCTLNCDTDAACPDGSHCATVREGLRICAKTCTAHDQCRADGYRCHAPFTEVSSNELLECGPAATGTRAIGDACSAVWECSGGAPGRCNRDWPGGYCTLECQIFFGTCPAGATCSNQRCLKSCSSAADCRSGYDCVNSTCQAS